MTPLDVAACRREFPALQRQQAGQTVIFADGPAGSQVPRAVADAVANYLLHHNANHQGVFATSAESDAMLAEAHQAAADWFGTTDPGEVAFGANMTTLCLALSRAVARTWQQGDQIMVTRLDHDANVSPWVLAARNAGAEVRFVRIRPEDCTLDLNDFRAKLSPRTKLVALGCASNAAGTINPVGELVAAAQAVGALVCLDAVHFAPHALLDVVHWNADFVLCSAYKFFGPHVGLMWGKRNRLEQLQPFKVRPASDQLPDRWMTGTQNHEGIVGVTAAINYVAGLAEVAPTANRRDRLASAFQRLAAHERELAARFLAGVANLPGWKVWGITAPERLAERVSTFALTHRRHTPLQAARFLAEQGIFAWHGNFYALELTESLGLESAGGLLRLGFLHYNTEAEVDRVLKALGRLDDAP